MLAQTITLTDNVRLTLEQDPYPDLSWLEQDCFEGEDPNDYISLVAVLETRCPCCECWSCVDAIGGLDYRLDARIPDLITYRGEEIQSLIESDEYIGSIVRDMLLSLEEENN